MLSLLKDNDEDISVDQSLKMFSLTEADGKPMQDPNVEIWEPVALLELSDFKK